MHSIELIIPTDADIFGRICSTIEQQSGRTLEQLAAEQPHVAQQMVLSLVGYFVRAEGQHPSASVDLEEWKSDVLFAVLLASRETNGMCNIHVPLHVRFTSPDGADLLDLVIPSPPA